MREKLVDMNGSREQALPADWNAWLALMVGRSTRYGGRPMRVRTVRLTPDRQRIELVCVRPARSQKSG